MSTKNKIIISIVVLVPVILILGFIGFKCYMLSYYKIPAYSLDYSQLDIKSDEKDVKTDKSLANSKFKTINFYLPNVFEKKIYDEDADFVVSYVNK